MVTLDRSECNFASQIRHLEMAQLAKTQIRIDFPSKIICHKNQMKHIESDRVSPPNRALTSCCSYSCRLQLCHRLTTLILSNPCPEIIKSQVVPNFRIHKAPQIGCSRENFSCQKWQKIGDTSWLNKKLLAVFCFMIVIYDFPGFSQKQESGFRQWEAFIYC